jgi:lipopolysaccharide/colanic/teichoic acid biosynthesis glycosyltransferase
MNPALDTSLHDRTGSRLLGPTTFGTDTRLSAAYHRVVDTDYASVRIRRAFNVVLAATALVICAPVMLAVALLVKLTSPGPVIYKQTRVGLDRRNLWDRTVDGRRAVDYGGRLFTIYKFRTMTADPGATQQVWARPGDARITTLGRILRKYRLDELPQLVNVLKGDMNVVGPRPEQPRIFVELREQVAGYQLRQRVLPGITGWAQINHHYDRSIEDVRTKVVYDLQYIEKQSLAHDLKIVVQTLPVMLFKQGAL